MPTADVFRPDAIARGLGRANTGAFQALVDWENDGTFSHPYDDVTAYVRAEPGITAKRGMDQVRPLGTIAAGTLGMDLDNQAQTFSPENGSSVLAGLLTAGRTTRLRALNGSAVVNLLTGVLDDVQPHPELLKQTVSLPSLGSLAALRMTGNSTQPPPISTALYQSITTDVAIGHVLDAAGWSATKRVLHTGDITLDWWWVDNQDALTALQELVNTEGPGARMYEDGSGNIVFEPHTYRFVTARSTTSQATFSDGSAGHTTEPLHSEPFAYNPGLKDIVNQCTLTATVRSMKALTQVWSTTEVLNVPPAGTLKRTATAGDPFENAVTPVSGTDFTVVYGSITSVTLDRTSGSRATITLTAGANGAQVTGLGLRAHLVSTDAAYELSTTIDTSASVANFGQRLYPLQVRSEVNANTLQDLANAIPLWWQNPRPSLSTTLISSPRAQDARYIQAVTREVSDRVTVQASKASLNADCWVESVAHNIQQAGLVMTTTHGLEKVLAQKPWIWDTSTWDSSAGDVWWF